MNKYRLRSWHQATIEDERGCMIAQAGTAEDARRILALLNAPDANDGKDGQMLGQTMLDITGAEFADITVRADRKVIWVNVDGRCRLRISRIKGMRIDDLSKESGS